MVVQIPAHEKEHKVLEIGQRNQEIADESDRREERELG